VRLAQNRDHLFVGKPALLHDFLFSVGSHSLNFQMVRKFQGRSLALQVQFCQGEGNEKESSKSSGQ
ncbi:hypothetical protein, partial [Burkholderia sp. Ac-20344]|uniref:hypothetical protein n=1 Tax=Burkholderia sp. Ac-20344 TaxID=2703890 RepID=UPI00197C2F81